MRFDSCLAACRSRPCPQVAPKLMSTNALLRGTQVNRKQPFVQRDLGVFKDGPYRYRERLATTGALVQALPSALIIQLVRFADQTAMRTYRTIRPNLFFEALSRRFFVVVLTGLDGGHKQSSLFCLV
jgi:hypothetical protein